MIIPVVTLMGYWNTMTSMTQICNICIHLLRTWIRSGSDLRFPAVWSAAAEAMLCPCRWFSYPKSWRNQRSWAEHRVAHGNMMHFSLVTSREKKPWDLPYDVSLKTQKTLTSNQNSRFPPNKPTKNNPVIKFSNLKLVPNKIPKAVPSPGWVGLRPTKRKGRSWGLKCQTSVRSESSFESTSVGSFFQQ